MRKIFSKIAGLMLGLSLAMGVGVALSSHSTLQSRATEGDTHSITDFTGVGVGVVINNGTTPDDITITNPGYSVKQVIINWTHNKSNDGLTATVTVGGGSLGSGKVGGTKTTTNTTIGDGNTSLSGDVSITWTNGMSGTGKGTLTLNSITLVEGAGGGGGEVTTYTISYNANGGSGSMSDSAGTNPAVAECTFTAPNGKQFSKWNTAANGSGSDYAVGATPKADLSLYAIWEDKPNSEKLTATATTDFVSPWSVDNTPGGIETTGSARGWQWSGGNSATITYETDKTVEKVLVSASTNSTATLSVTVGGKDFGESQSLSTKAEYIFEGSESGNVVISLTNSGTKSVWCDSIEIFFNDKLDSAIENNSHSEGPFELILGGSSMTFMFYDASGEYHERIYDDLDWAVSDSTVLHLTLNSTECYVEGLKVGTAYLTCSAPGYKEAQVSISVIEDPSLPKMEIWDNTWAVGPGDAYRLSTTPDIYIFTVYLEGDTEKEFDDRTFLEADTWTSSDTSVATVTRRESGACSLTTLKPGSTTLTATKDGYQSASVQINVTAGNIVELEVTGSMTKTSYTTADSWDPTGLTVKKVYEYGDWKEEITSGFEWSYNPSSPADGVSSVVATATLTIGTDVYSGSSSAQVVTVTVAHAGTAADPFTVAEALAKANEIGTVGNSGQGPWVTKGIISRVTSAPAATYWNATYYISDDGKQANELQVYRGFYLDNAKFDADTAALLTAGKIVTVTGNLTGSYGCEYCQGNYLLSIEEQDMGDVDVTFAPESSNLTLGATGTFTASSETSGATFTWSVDNSTVLSVNASTGAYEALALGVARVTVTASAGGKEGTAYVDFVVNGSAGSYYSVSDANTIASGVTSGQTTAYYIYVEGYVKEFATSMSGSSPRAFDIMTLDESASIMVYTGTSSYSTFIEGLSIGDRIVVKGKLENYNSKYEIVEPEKVGSNASAITFALEFIEATDAVCTAYDGVTDNGEALEAIWEGLATSYGSLYDNQKSVLMGAERNEKGTHVEQAVARYDYLVGKYKLDNFITGRTPVSFAGSNSVIPGHATTNSSTIVIVVVALTSITSIGVLLVIKRKRSLVK